MMSSRVDENSFRSGLFFTPPPKWETSLGDTLPVIPRTESYARRSLYHVRHKVPPANSPYGIAKRVQLVDKDPSRAVSLFWAAINAGDRVDSALKDMAVIMKQLNRSDEAIEAIKSFRHLCPFESQESLDNILLELYKRSGKIQEEIQMLQVKVKHIEEGISFSRKRTKVGRSQGRKVHITIEKEYSRLVGKLAWAYFQQKDYKSAEEYYRKALSLEPDKNKQCNLAICLMHLNKMMEAKFILQTVRNSCRNGHTDESFTRSFERATQILRKFESGHSLKPINEKKDISGEIHESFSSHARGNITGPQTANVTKLDGPQILKGSSQIHGASSLLLNFHDSNVSLSGSKRRNIKGTLCGSRQLCNGEMEEDSVCMNKYDAASFSLDKTPGVLFTQPQKCLRLGNKGNHWYAEGSNAGCSRKLLFQPEKNCEEVQQYLRCHNIDKEPESARSLSSQDRRKNIWGDPAAKINGGEDFNLDTRMKNFPDPEEDGNQIRKSRKQQETNIEEYLKEDCSRRHENRKSWADMVEEEDDHQEEFGNERRDYVLSPNDFKQFADENRNSNVIEETPSCSMKNQCESLSQKIESLILRDGYYTQPLYDDDDDDDDHQYQKKRSLDHTPPSRDGLFINSKGAVNFT